MSSGVELLLIFCLSLLLSHSSVIRAEDESTETVELAAPDIQPGCPTLPGIRSQSKWYSSPDWDYCFMIDSVPSVSTTIQAAKERCEALSGSLWNHSDPDQLLQLKSNEEFVGSQPFTGFVKSEDIWNLPEDIEILETKSPTDQCAKVILDASDKGNLVTAPCDAVDQWICVVSIEATNRESIVIDVNLEEYDVSEYSGTFWLLFFSILGSIVIAFLILLIGLPCSLYLIFLRRHIRKKLGGRVAYAVKLEEEEKGLGEKLKNDQPIKERKKTKKGLTKNKPTSKKEKKEKKEKTKAMSADNRMEKKSKEPIDNAKTTSEEETEENKKFKHPKKQKKNKTNDTESKKKKKEKKEKKERREKRDEKRETVEKKRRSEEPNPTGRLTFTKYPITKSPNSK